MIILLSLYQYPIASDFIVDLFHLTFTEAKIQSVNISIVDDDLVEPSEIIQIILTPLTPARILTNLDSATIEIIDNDGECHLLNMIASNINHPS